MRLILDKLTKKKDIPKTKNISQKNYLGNL